jgi:hypothetical protein
MQFRSTHGNWQEQEDVNWGEISTILSRFRGDGSLGFNVNHTGGGAYSGSLRLLGTGSWQQYMFLNEEAEEFAGAGGAPDPARIQAARDRAERERSFTSSWDIFGSVRPFFQSEIWGNSNFEYNLRGLLVRNTVDTAGDRSWETGQWDKDNIEIHQVTANVAANIMDHNQTLSISAVLPPRDAFASTNATFRKWISETNIRASVQEPWDSDLRKFDPVYITETLRFRPRVNFQQYVVFTPEENQYTTLTSRLNLWSFNASYSMLYAEPWRFNPLFGDPDAGNQPLWERLSERRLEPQEFRLGYNRTFIKENLWERRLSFLFNVNSNMAFDLQRYTNSRLNFSMGIGTRIANFMDLRFSTASENAVLYRYFQGTPFFDAPPTTLYPGYETNFFTDLFNSFRFDKPELRKSSGFKLKSMNVSLIHHLGDWNARLTIHSTPFRPEGSTTYVFNNEISFLIRWVPISEIRTQVDHTRDGLRIR